MSGEGVGQSAERVHTSCPTCSCHDPSFVSPEPPVGTWVKDRHGRAHYRQSAEGWGEPGFYPTGRWAAMWAARGPLVECGPWGKEVATLPAGSEVRDA